MHEKKHFCLILLVSLLISGTLIGQPLLSRDQIGHTLTHFYQHPDSATLKLLIRSLQESRESREALPSAPVIGFFTGILLSDSPNRKIAERELKALTNRFELFDYALYFGKSQDTILHWTNRKPDSNDLIWGAFFSTGNTRYLDKLVGEIPLMEREDSLAVYMTGASAKWSLATNAQLHETIRTYLTQAKSGADDHRLKVLDELLTGDPAKMREAILKKMNELRAKEK